MDCSNIVPRYQTWSACTCPWGHAAKCYCWSRGSDMCYHQPHPLEACCHWNFGDHQPHPLEACCHGKFAASEVHGDSSEDHTSSRPCLVEDGPTGSLHKCSGLDDADEEFVWNEGWSENHQEPALDPWLPCLQGSPCCCQPPPSPLGVGTEVAESDNGPLAPCHLRWQGQIPTLTSRWQAYGRSFTWFTWFTLCSPTDTSLVRPTGPFCETP